MNVPEDFLIGASLHKLGITCSALLAGDDVSGCLTSIAEVTNEVVLDLYQFTCRHPQCTYQNFTLWLACLFGENWPIDQPPTVKTITQSVKRILARRDKLKKLCSSNEKDQYFISIPYDAIKDIPGHTACPTDYLSFSDIPPFQFKPITEESVIKEIASLDSHKAAGHDSLPSILVKKVRLFISIPIAHIINGSFEEGIFPDYWKRSIIIPIQKKKGCTELRNFRPISILPVLSKVIERVGQEQLIDYLLENNLITPFQSGFRAGFSTQDVLLRVTNSWVKAVDERKYVGAVFLDIAKVFDCIDHSILVEKLPYIMV